MEPKDKIEKMKNAGNTRILKPRTPEYDEYVSNQMQNCLDLIRYMDGTIKTTSEIRYAELLRYEAMWKATIPLDTHDVTTLMYCVAERRIKSPSVAEISELDAIMVKLETMQCQPTPTSTL